MLENEIKIVARYTAWLEESLIRQYGWHDIHQGYLNNNSRVREITHQSGMITHVFSYKQRLPTGRNVEIEAEITRADFDDLWPFTESRLFKRRVSRFLTHHDEVLRWDIDFPRWGDETYFAIAEVEMPKHMERPPFMLEDIVQHLVYEVPRSDSRFSARKLSDADYARKQAIELGLL